jgi:hypothetical protein
MGKRLLPRADFHIGAHVNKFMQLRTRQPVYTSLPTSGYHHALIDMIH